MQNVQHSELQIIQEAMLDTTRAHLIDFLDEQIASLVDAGQGEIAEMLERNIRALGGQMNERGFYQ